jgi:hypothetical protein
MAETTETTARLITIEPILAVRDVATSAAYYRDVLGFEYVWLWGEPPTHGGANQGGVGLQFSLNPALAESAEGREIWIRVGNVQAMYALHQESRENLPGSRPRATPTCRKEQLLRQTIEQLFSIASRRFRHESLLAGRETERLRP